MTSWSDFEKAERALATTVRERFQKHTHQVLGTLRKDGSPRLTGLEVRFLYGELWLGMMPGSLKARDLFRDPRFSLFANPGAGTGLDGGDVRVSGRAVECTDPDSVRRYTEDVDPPTPFHLFRVDVEEVVRVTIEGDTMVVVTWRPGVGLTSVRRGAD